MAASSGLSMPVSRRADRRARTGEHAIRRRAVAVDRAAVSSTTPLVSVPVLSVHRTSALPRFSIAESRRRTTDAALGHLARAGRQRMDTDDRRQQFGGQPHRQRDGEQERCRSACRGTTGCTASTKSTMIVMIRVSRYPNLWMPRSKSVSPAEWDSPPAIRPTSVVFPVRTTRILAEPLRTEVPRNDGVDASAAAAHRAVSAPASSRPETIRR